MPHQNHSDRDTPDLVIDHTDRGTIVLRNPAVRSEWIESTVCDNLAAWI
jgi:hypothetical protein